MKFNLKEIAEHIGGEVVGDGATLISGLAKIEEAAAGDLTFLANPKYAKYVATTAASAVIFGQDFSGECKKPSIRVDDPYFAFLKAIQLFFPPHEALAPGIHSTAVVDETAQIGEDAAIGALALISRNVHLGSNVKIHPGVMIYPDVMVGEDSIIYANVTIREEVQIGKRVIVHCGAVLGADGFGYVSKGGHYHKLPQAGTVVIEDDVEIGANTTIDRATLGATVIRRGVKLDNLIQIAHNVEVGENTVMAAQTGVSGSTRIGKQVRAGGQVGFVGHISIGDGSTIGAQAGVTKDVPPGILVVGYPAQEISAFQKSVASLRKLPELLKKIRRLEKEVERLSKKE